MRRIGQSRHLAALATPGTPTGPPDAKRTTSTHCCAEQAYSHAPRFYPDAVATMGPPVLDVAQATIVRALVISFYDAISTPLMWERDNYGLRPHSPKPL